MHPGVHACVYVYVYIHMCVFIHIYLLHMSVHVCAQKDGGNDMGRVLFFWHTATRCELVM